MKKLKFIGILLIIMFLNTNIVKAESVDYKKIYINYIKTKGIDENSMAKVLFYDIDGDSIPEMILNTSKLETKEENFFITYEILKINQNKVEKIFTINNRTETLQKEPVIFFNTNNDKNLYYVMQDYNFYGNPTYYKLTTIQNKVQPILVGKVENSIFLKNLC